MREENKILNDHSNDQLKDTKNQAQAKVLLMKKELEGKQDTMVEADGHHHQNSQPQLQGFVQARHRCYKGDIEEVAAGVEHITSLACGQISQEGCLS